MPTYLSRKAFADSQGWSPSYVTKLGLQGRLIMSPDGKSVDVDATLAKLGKTADPSKEGVRQRHVDTRTQRDVRSQVTADASDTAEPQGGSSDYYTHKASREKYLALLAQAEYDKVCGNTVERQAVEEATYRYARLLRDSVMGLPKQISSDLAAISDPWKLERELSDRLRKMLEDVTKLGEDDLNKAMTE